MHRLTRNETQKLFLKSKTIFKAAFFYVKIHYSTSLQTPLKNIIVIPKKCGIAVRRNYIRRITKNLIKKYNLENINKYFIFIYIKTNLDHITYNDIEKFFIEYINY